MTLHTRKDGAWTKVNKLFVRQSGVWTPVKNAYVRDGGVWKVYYTSEIVVNVSVSTSGLSMQDLFSNEDWLADTPKRVVIQPGVVIGGHAWAALSAQYGGPATTETFGGTLTLDNYGTIQGIGGSPGAQGGAALYDNDGVTFTRKVQVNNYGTIRAGGGGGGQGGGGSVTNASNTGEMYSDFPSTYWQYDQNYSPPLVSGLSSGATQFSQRYSSNPTSHTSGNTTYYRGSLRRTSGNSTYYGITIVTTTQDPTTGGAGGRGVGSDGAAAAGAAGGTNAGAGGAGGDWGANGSAGAAGTVSAGSAGGLAGIAYSTGIWIMNNQGTIQGRVL